MPAIPTFLQRFWHWLLPRRRRRLVPWNGFELLLIVLVLFVGQYLLWRPVAYWIMQRSNFLAWLYGAGFVRSMAGLPGSPDRTIAEFRALMWCGVLWLPLHVAIIVGMCRLLGGRPYQLGVTTHRWARNVLAGALGGLVAAPLQILNPFLNFLYQRLFHAAPTEHPLSLIGQLGSPIDCVMIVISATLAAPIMEELFFRGLLQSWFTRRRMGGMMALAFAFGLAILYKWEPIQIAWTTADWNSLLLALHPATFIVLTAPGLFLILALARSEPAGGIYGTALLFAAAHTPIFPSPIPLFPLGLLLGWLAYRTNSLVGPIVLHSLFNLIACVEMFVFHTPAT